MIDPDLIGKQYETNSKRIREKIKSEFLKHRCGTVELITDKPFEKLILKFFVEERTKWK